MNHTTLNHAHTRGFTLLEVLIAILVLGIGLVSIAKFHGHLIQSNHYAKARSLALLLAQEKIAVLRNAHLSPELASLQVPATGLTAELPNRPSRHREPGTVYSGIEFQREWLLQAICYSQETMRHQACRSNASKFDYTHVQVQVSWQDANGSLHQESLESLLLPATPLRSLLSVAPSHPE